MLRWLAGCSLLLVSGAASAQQAPVAKARVFVADSDSWQMTSNSGFGWSGLTGASASHSGGGARPQTAEIIKTFGERCPGVTVNNRVEMTDYVVRLDHEGGKGLLSHKNKVAVFVRRSGDSIFSKSTLSVGGSVQSACEAIAAHWGAHAAEVTTEPVAAAPVAMSSLTVETNVAGAEISVDGEFMGNAPSTLSVAPGKHVIAVAKKGYAAWSRTMMVSGNAVRVSAELEKE